MSHYLRINIFFHFHVSLQIVTKRTRSLTLNLERREHNGPPDSRNLGQLTVLAEEYAGSKITAEMIFRCSDLENKDLFSKSVSVFF